MSSDVIAAPPLYQRQRRWSRLKFNVPVRAIVRRSDAALIRQGRGVEMSEGGMCLVAFLELQVNELVTVEFTPPYSGTPIRVSGRVRNRNGYRYGVEFCNQTELDQENISRLRDALKMFSACAKGDE